MFFSCKKNINEENESAHQHKTFLGKTGKVEGKVMSKNGNYVIKQANVYIDFEGEIFLTKSDLNGEFSLNAPVGDHELFIATGDGQKFRTVVPTTISENQVTYLASQASRLQQVSKIAYVAGEYDNIQTIVEDSLGYSIDSLSVLDLGNLFKMKTYDAIFLNCGTGYSSMDSLSYNNIKSYVADGGSIYASDWAIGYLIGNDDTASSMIINSSNFNRREHTVVSHNANRSCAPRAGGFLPSSVLCSDKIGVSQLNLSQDVIATDIQALLGKTQLDIDYDLGAWEVINNHGPEFDVLIEDNVYGNGPLAIRSNLQMLSFLGGGATTGGGNGNGNFVTICHIPPGNPNNPITITVSSNAVPAHISHGDNIGSCQGKGGILYTTFHNHPQGNVSEDVKDILEYFILNL